jgi:hypothetical protein
MVMISEWWTSTSRSRVIRECAPRHNFYGAAGLSEVETRSPVNALR